MDDGRTYYQILGLERAATLDQITAARRRLVQLYHPDKNPAVERDECTRKTITINEAYGVLSDRLKRAEYDEKLDEEAYVAASRAESYTKTYTRSYSANQPYQNHGSAHGSHRGGSKFSGKHPEYGNFNSSKLDQLYLDVKSWVIRHKIHTKKELREHLSGIVNNKNTLDSLTVDFLDELCADRVLERREGESGRTTYGFLDPDDGYVDEDEDEDDGGVNRSAPDSNECEADPVENRQAEKPRRPRKQRSRRLLGIIFWLVVAGWAWHHFVGRPATQVPTMQTANGVSLRSGQVTIPPSAQRARESGAEHTSAPNALQTSPAESASAPTAVGVNAPTPDSERTAPQLGVTANPSTSGDSAQQNGPSDRASSSDWHIVREVPPAYPIAALRMGESGTTIVEVKLDADGNVVDAQVHKSSGYHDLDRAAVRAVRKFEFAPADGEAANGGGTVLVPVAFQRQDSPG